MERGRRSRLDGQEENQYDSDIAVHSPRASFKNHIDLSRYAFTSNSNIDVAKSNGLERMQAETHSTKRKRHQAVSNIGSMKSSRSAQSIKQNDAIAPSIYAHLPELRDVLAPNLICIFIGLNPGLTTARTGHAFAHPSNLFWKLLHSSGCTPRRCEPREDGELPKRYALGNTNIVSRPTRNSSELKKSELDAGVNALEDKIRKYRPEAVCIVGKSIWESIWRTKYGKTIPKRTFRYGWQDDSERMGVNSGENLDWKGASVFVACSTSGLAASLKPAEKEVIWKEFGDWVKEIRRLRNEKQEDVGI